jgi:hypothetical protein
MNPIEKELRVALSRRAQPVWFRVVKWTVFISVTILLWSSPYFWWWLGGGIALGLVVHFIYRWKTKGWTKGWGGWNDLDNGKH